MLKESLIYQYPVVSFDVFDTLIERDIDDPTDIFYIVGEAVLGYEYVGQFKLDRIKAEQIARDKKASGEVVLDEIYMELDGVYGNKTELLKAREIETELQYCRPKQKIIPIYKKCCELGKTVLLISDMYLPPSIIEKMLEKCEISEYSKLFVSNEYEENKRTGRLFKAALEELSIAPKDIIHIGDSIKADLLGPRKEGIRSVLIGRKNRLRRLFH